MLGGQQRGLTLHESRPTHIGFLQIVHPLQDLPHQESELCQAGIIGDFEKMVCFQGNHCYNRKIQNVKYLSRPYIFKLF